MSTKLIIFIILSFLAGIGFIAAGIYFIKLNAKGTAYTALSIGALTIVFASMLIVFPPLAAPLALTYMIFLIIAFIALFIIYK